MRGVHYGHYTADFIPKQDSPYEGPEDGYTFVKPQSKLLNTRGVYTVTIYPSAEGDTSLSEDSPTSVCVAWSPGCNKIQWSKGGRRNVNTGPRLDLKSTEDAGLYTIHDPSNCPPGEFYGVNAGACTPRTVPCLNGGVPKSRSDECTCPPLFLGSDCTEVANYPGFGDFPLGSTQGPWLQCGDLPGGNRECKGYLFCYGDLYGCTCGPGWHGNNCDKPCPKGKWGADCNQRCPADNTDCDRFFGEKITTEISM